MDTIETQSIKQKMILFSNNPEMVEAAIAVLQRGMRRDKLVGESEYATLVNAITMDSQADMMIQFIDQVEFIKKGGLLTTEL